MQLLVALIIAVIITTVVNEDRSDILHCKSLCCMPRAFVVAVSRLESNF